MHREHGRHNKAVCDKLNLIGDLDCNDWIVTTAFYAAIHFIEYWIFPCNHGKTPVNSVEEAMKATGAKNKHQARTMILNHLNSPYANEYEFLKTHSHNARYVDFNIRPEIARKAIVNLEKIMATCDKDKP